MAAIIATRIRLLINAQQWNYPQLLDQLTKAAPAFAPGGDLSVELLITEDGTNLLDYTNVADLTVEISARSNPLNANVIVAQQILIGSITTGVTVSQFQTAGSTQQAAQIIIPNAALQMLVNGSSNYVLAVYAESGDVPAKRRPLLVMNIVAVDADLPTGNVTLPPSFKAGSKLSFLCSDAQTRDVTLKQTPNGKWTLDISQAGYNGPAQASYSVLCADNLYRDLTVILVDGVWTIDINQAGHN